MALPIMPNLSSSSSYATSQTVSGGDAQTKQGGVKYGLITNNVATGKSSLSANASASEFDWKTLAIVAGIGLFGWLVIKKL